MENQRNGMRTFVILLAVGLAMTVGVVTTTAEPAQAIYVHWEADVDSGDLEATVCTGSKDDTGVCV